MRPIWAVNLAWTNHKAVSNGPGLRPEQFGIGFWSVHIRFAAQIGPKLAPVSNLPFVWSCYETYLSRRHLGTRHESTLRLVKRVAVKESPLVSAFAGCLTERVLVTGSCRDGAAAPTTAGWETIFRTLGSLRPDPNPTIGYQP